MKSATFRLTSSILASALVCLLPAGCSPSFAPMSSPRPTIIDMHLHTLWWEPGMEEPATGLLAPATPDELMQRTLAELDRYGIVKAVASGDQIDSYRAALGERLIPGVLIIGQPTLSVEALRAMHGRGDLAVLAEFAPQYGGWGPTTPELEPYWALAEELDIPVGIHMGPGPPSAPYVGYPDYRMQLSNPLALEDVLIRHPSLRVYVMHAGWPFLDEMIGLLYAHPQVYVDISVIDWVIPKDEFHAYLQRLVDAGFSRRIMFGSDNMMWPQSFAISVSRIESARFLTNDQRSDIFCRNAARFLRLPDSTCDS